MDWGAREPLVAACVKPLLWPPKLEVAPRPPTCLPGPDRFGLERSASQSPNLSDHPSPITWTSFHEPVHSNTHTILSPTQAFFVVCLCPFAPSSPLTAATSSRRCTVALSAERTSAFSGLALGLFSQSVVGSLFSPWAFLAGSQAAAA